MSDINTYKVRLREWEAEAKTNAHGMARYAPHAIRLLEDKIQKLERNT